MVAAYARAAAGQADIAPAQAPAQKVADDFLQLLTARQVDVKTLREADPAELPYFRLRLYVAPNVPDQADQAWTGIDHDLFRDNRETHDIELAVPNGVFRASLNEALSDPSSATTDPDEAGVRIVDVWCRHSGNAGRHVPLIVRVINAQGAGIDGGSEQKFLSGRVCHNDVPELVECLRLLNALPVFEQPLAVRLSADPAAAGILAAAIADYRSGVAQIPAIENSLTTNLIPGGALIELKGPQGIPMASCNYDKTEPRILPSGESFIGLAPDAEKGTATITLPLPFPRSGGAAVWAPAAITDETAILEVEASSDGQQWTRLYRLDAAAMYDEGQHVLPASMLGASKIMIRARLTSRNASAGSAREGTLRFLAAPSPFPSIARVECVNNMVRVLRREHPLAAVSSYLRLIAQPTVLDAHGVSALVLEAGGDGGLEADVYAPCELDKDTCRDISDYRGVIRFWSPSDWQATPPEWLADMVAGPGWIIFPRMKEPSVALAKVLVAGKKSLRFPEVIDPSCELLDALAQCSGELALDGIKTLSPEQSLALSHYNGPKLSLAGLRSAHCAHAPSESLLRAIVESPGTCTLSGLTELDETTAKVLAAGNKHFAIDDVVSLSAPVAAALSRTDQGLSLNAVTSLDQAAAGKLLSYAGEYLSLAGLREVQCGIDDLPAADGRRSRSLSSLLMPTRTAVEEAEMKRQDCLEELQAIFREAVARGVHREEDREQFFARAAVSDEAMQDSLEQNRIDHPEFQTYCKVRIGDADGTPLDAFVRSPGVFTLQPRSGLAVGKSRFNIAVAQSLARGRKHLNLDCLVDRDLTPEIATVLGTFGKVVSLDGIRQMTPELAASLAQYKGPLLSLAGVAQVAPEDEAVLLPLIQANHAILPDAGMLNIAGLRDFVLNCRKAKVPVPGNQKALYDSFLDRSKNRQWAVLMPARKLQVQAVLLLQNDVEFDDAGVKIRGPRALLTPQSQQTLGKLQDDAKAVAVIRKEDLLKDR
jgi:hypothetical protein